MITYPKCNRCGTLCGLWWTGEDWWCPACMWAEVKQLRVIVEAVETYAALRARAEEPTAEQWAADEAKWQTLVQQVEALAAKVAKEDRK